MVRRGDALRENGTYPEAAQWYGRAAELGNAHAQNELAFMYRIGQGVPQDYEQAVWWYRKAAEQGFAKGQLGLCFMYFHGLGVQRDLDLAEQWCQKAAAQGEREYFRF